MFIIFREKLQQNLIRLVLNDTSKRTYAGLYCSSQLPMLFPVNRSGIRSKSKKSQKDTSRPTLSESGTEESTWDDQIVDKNTKVMQINLKSMRTDGVLKSGLGIARNKIETLFYESKIRVNGQKLLKKSELVNEGDEIDIVKSVNVNNPNFLTVARLEVLGVTQKGDSLNVKIRRCKSLTIENYDTNVNFTKD